MFKYSTSSYSSSKISTNRKDKGREINDISMNHLSIVGFVGLLRLKNFSKGQGERRKYIRYE